MCVRLLFFMIAWTRDDEIKFRRRGKFRSYTISSNPDYVTGCANDGKHAFDAIHLLLEQTTTIHWYDDLSYMWYMRRLSHHQLKSRVF